MDLIKANKTSSDALRPTFPKILLKALKNFALLVANEHLNLAETSRYIPKYLADVVHWSLWTVSCRTPHPSKMSSKFVNNFLSYPVNRQMPDKIYHTWRYRFGHLIIETLDFIMHYSELCWLAFWQVLMCACMYVWR